jgi:aminodeoxyfutalosine deaminase
MIRTVHSARYVLSEAGLLLRNAAVHISHPGRITRVEPSQNPPPNLETRVIDWGSAIILPGLINAHAHLELTRMRKLPGPDSFTGWLSMLMSERQKWTGDDFLASAAAGARLSLASGVTLVGDISASGFGAQSLRQHKLRKVIFEEITALLPEKADQAVADLQARISATEPDSLLTCGASPHAPYSVSAPIFAAVAHMARRRGIRLTTHVAETAGEVEFLIHGSGEFRDFLSRLGVLPDGWRPPGIPPVPYLESLGVLDQPALLAHGNYLDRDSMARIMNRSCSVVYCPRSHAYFGFDPHPVRQLLDMGINVALGTDSLASNDSLSILDEMRFLFRIRPDLKCDEILRMATLNGAVALDFGGVLGRLRRGYWADMTVLRLPETFSDRNVVAQILEGAGDCLATIVQGEVVWNQS